MNYWIKKLYLAYLKDHKHNQAFLEVINCTLPSFSSFDIENNQAIISHVFTEQELYDIIHFKLKR